jgi:hypothetical protein
VFSPTASLRPVAKPSFRLERTMSREKKQDPGEPPTEPPCPPDDVECLLDDLEQDLAEPHVPLDGAPPDHWKHVDALTEEERLNSEAAKEEHQERMAHGRPRGKI